MHTVALIFDFVQPLVASRRRVDQLRELRRDPFRPRCRATAGLLRRLRALPDLAVAWSVRAMAAMVHISRLVAPAMGDC
jgi:hypothetical protein